jgi:hypothetical protein
MHTITTSPQRAATISLWVAWLCLTVSTHTRSAEPDAHDAARAGGIWKAATPRTPMNGEFNSMDPLGVAAGALIKADCSLNWVDPDNGALYCFSSGTSLEYFLDHPKISILRAQQGWQKLHGVSSGAE